MRICGQPVLVGELCLQGKRTRYPRADISVFPESIRNQVYLLKSCVWEYAVHPNNKLQYTQISSTKTSALLMWYFVVICVSHTNGFVIVCEQVNNNEYLTN
jgi:hypothetical protein